MIDRAARAALALAFLASTASAQGVDPRLVQRLDSGTRVVVAAVIDSARAAGLPTEPLVDKALEGAARNQPSIRVVAAVRTLAAQLRDARAALGTGASHQEIFYGAQAIRAGVPPGDLVKIRSMKSGIRIATALMVVSDIVPRGVPVDTAVSVVTALMRAAASDDQLLAVRADIERDILSGKPADVAASIRGHALEQTLAASSPPHGAGSPGTLPSPVGTSRAGDAGPSVRPPGSAVGTRSPSDGPSRPPVPPRGTPTKRP